MLLSYGSLDSIPEIDINTGPYVNLEELLNRPFFSSAKSLPAENVREENNEIQNTRNVEQFAGYTPPSGHGFTPKTFEDIPFEDLEEDIMMWGDCDYMHESQAQSNASSSFTNSPQTENPGKRLMKPTHAGGNPRKTSSTRRNAPMSSHQKPVKCPHSDCTFTASQKGDLKRHLTSLKHKKKGDIVCEIPGCSKVFTRPDACKRHMLRARH